MGLFDRFKKIVTSNEAPQKPIDAPPIEEVLPPVEELQEERSEWGAEGTGKYHLIWITDRPKIIQDLELMVSQLRETWHVAITSDEAHALDLAGKIKLDAVICDGGTKNWREFLSKICPKNSQMIRFVRCAPNESGMAVFGPDHPQLISTEMDAEGLTNVVNRAMNLQVWMGNEDLRKMMAKMECMPSVPALYSQVITELAKPECSINFVGRLISKDPAQTAKVLQCVNSVAFGLAREISDPVEAVMQMGCERTKSVLLVSSVFLQFANHPCPGFSHDKWWQHSMVVGGFARLLTAQETKDAKLGELAFTAGLMHDTGKLLLAANFPDVYGKILDQAQRRNIEVALVEKEVFGVTHAEIGACFLGKWNLPFSILSAIGWHHNPVQSADDVFSLLSAVHAGNAFENEKKYESQGIRRSRLQLAYLQKIDAVRKTNRWRQACGCLPKDEVDPFAPQKAA
jgi:HD-like signal output (HDOD) protein